MFAKNNPQKVLLNVMIINNYYYQMLDDYNLSKVWHTDHK